MTPLYQRIVRELTLPKKDRTFDDWAGILPKLNGAICFETTAVADLIDSVARKIPVNPRSCDHLTFLPAEKTWIEYTTPDRYKIGFFLEQEKGDWARGEFFTMGKSVPHHAPTWFRFRVRNGLIDSSLSDEVYQYCKSAVFKSDPAMARATFLNTIATLALINSPRVIGRRSHAPHAALQRALLARRDLIGHWPLQAWHEIKLEVKPPKEYEGPLVNGNLTGTRALHFVRAYSRVRYGKIEFIDETWRGEGSKGIKQTRYRLVPPKNGAPPPVGLN